MNTLKTNTNQVESKGNEILNALLPLFRPVDGSAPKFNVAQKIGLALFSVGEVFTASMLSYTAWMTAYNVAEPQHVVLSVMAGAMSSIALWAGANATKAMIDSFKEVKRA